MIIGAGPAGLTAAYELLKQSDIRPIVLEKSDHMGGIASDMWGRSSLDGLSVCGECSATGAHGANRLASNSLLEAVVFAARIARRLSG
ncbi:MAG: FAD-binding protein, partial [Holophagales bacterium]|nr:FAD-binding protein [Holophagales bacterium]